MKLDLSQPKQAWTVVTGLVVFLGVLPNLDKGWAIVRWVLDAFPAAYAGKELSQVVDHRLDDYLKAQENAANQQAAVAEALNAYVQQQQANAPMGEATEAPLREWSAQDGTYWCCATSDRDRCWADGLWARCR